MLNNYRQVLLTGHALKAVVRPVDFPDVHLAIGNNELTDPMLIPFSQVPKQKPKMTLEKIKTRDDLGKQLYDRPISEADFPHDYFLGLPL